MRPEQPNEQGNAWGENSAAGPQVMCVQHILCECTWLRAALMPDGS